MILSDQAILDSLRSGDIVIEPFCSKCLGSNSYDVHLGFLDVFSGTGTISFTEKTQPEYLFRTLLPQCVSIMARLP